jgi:hypothetical protein
MALLTDTARMALVLSVASCCFASSQTNAADEVRSLQYIETSGLISEEPHYEAHVMILDGAVKRTTLKGKDVRECIEIYDAKQGRRVFLFPDKREFVVVKGFKKAFLPPNPPRVDPVKPDPNTNLNVALRCPASLEVAAAKNLPIELVDGRAAGRMVIEEQYVQTPGIGARTRITTTWIEPTTNLPVKIESRDYPTGSREDGSVFTQRNIVFNAPLDESLFSTDPPAGYAVLPEREF